MPLYSIAKLIIFLYTTYFYTFFSISLLFWIFSVQIFLPNCQPLTVWHGFRYLADRKFNSNNKIFSIMNIKPLGDRVLVLPAPAEEKIGGIIIPDPQKKRSVVSSFLILPKRNPFTAPSRLLVREPRTRKWSSRQATKCCMASTVGQNSSSRERSI